MAIVRAAFVTATPPRPSAGVPGLRHIEDYFPGIAFRHDDGRHGESNRPQPRDHVPDTLLGLTKHLLFQLEQRLGRPRALREQQRCRDFSPAMRVNRSMAVAKPRRRSHTPNACAFHARDREIY